MFLPKHCYAWNSNEPETHPYLEILNMKSPLLPEEEVPFEGIVGERVSFNAINRIRQQLSILLLQAGRTRFSSRHIFLWGQFLLVTKRQVNISLAAK